jgi:hypothetical protein
MTKQIPQEIQDVLQEAATKYSESEATTNAGAIIRFIAKVIPVRFAVQLFSHLFKK